jgi:hypothetical protein
MSEAGEKETEERIRAGVRVVRIGHGANCSSIGSVVDTLFATAVVGGAIFTAVAAALASPRATPTPSPTPTPAPAPEEER